MGPMGDFGPLQVPNIGAADMGPSKSEQRRILAANIAMNLVISGGIPLVDEATRVSLSTGTAEKKFVDICTLIEKYIDNGTTGK